MEGWRRLRALPLAAVAALAFGLWLATTTPVLAPTFEVDGDWANGLDWGILTGQQFGKSIDFTLGPWAELDQPSILSLGLFLAAVVAIVITGILLIFVAWRLARNWLPALPAALAVALLAAPAIATWSGFSGRVLLLAVMCLIGLRVGALPQRWQRWVFAGLSILSAIALLAKFSNGLLAIATVVLIAAVCTEGKLARRVLAIVGVLGIACVTLILFWLFAGQGLDNFLPWFGASLQLTNGYAEAMAIDQPGLLGQYSVFASISALLLVLAVMRRGTSRIVLVVLVAWVAVVALRLGFTRHDVGHTPQSFLLLLVAGLGLGVTRQIWLGLVSVVISTVAVLAVGPQYLHVVDPVTIVKNTAQTVSAMVSSSYRAQLVAEARAAGASHYAVPGAVLSAVRGQSVHVDPVDSNVAWVYSLRWDPVPVFQSYSAYTPELDAINANALVASDGPEAVLRAPLYAIDGRNPMWESPLYMRALVCDFSPSVTSAKWQVLERSGSSRCGVPSVLSSVSFRAGESVVVPKAPGAGYMVVASFRVANSPVNWVTTEVFKPVSKLVVATDQGSFRLPRAHAGGPLILSLPKSAGWAAQFGGDTRVSTLSVNATGTVVFSAIPVSIPN